jgi:hypothetical protein
VAQSGDGKGTIITGYKILTLLTTGVAGVVSHGIPKTVLIAQIQVSPSPSAV